MTHPGVPPEGLQPVSADERGTAPQVPGDPLIAALDALVDDPVVDRSQFFSSAAAAAREAAFKSRYRILGVLGQGSMGLVYDAEDLRLHRRVAIKVIAARDATTAALMRRESEVLAALRHPGIVAVYDCGEMGDGSPYFVMEQVPGESLLDYCRSHDLGLRDKLALMELIARSVGMAHLLSVVHRDLKPQNIRVRPDGQPSILDFGIAKFKSAAAGDDPGDAIDDLHEESAVGDSLRPAAPYETLVRGGIKGTLRYMSPEQAAGEVVDSRSDVYALGLILCELLTGALPPEESAAKVRGSVPSQLAHQLRASKPHVPADVEAIIEKCLAPRADDRYANASLLADDLSAYLTGKAVAAVNRRRAVYCAKKFWQRHSLATALGTAAATLLIAVVAIAFWRVREERNVAREHAERAEANLGVAAAERARAERNLEVAQRAQRRAEDRELATERHLYTQQMGQAKALIDAGNLLQADLLLDRYSPASASDARGDENISQTAADHRSFAWHYLKRLCRLDHHRLADHQAPITCLRYSRDGILLASGDRDGSVRIWRADGVGTPRTLAAHRGAVVDVAFSADGRRLATIGEEHVCRVWDVESATRVADLHPLVNPLAIAALSSVALSRDGSHCATADTRAAVTLWDVASGAGRSVANAQLRAGPCYVDFSTDDTALVVAGKGHHVRMFDVASRRRMAQSPTLAGPLTRVCAGPTPDLVAAGDVFGCVYLLRQAGDKLECRSPLTILSGRIRDLSFSADGQAVVAVSESGAASATDIDTGRDITKLAAIARASSAIAAHVGPDRPAIAWSNDDHSVDVYAFPKTRGYEQFARPHAPIWLDVSPDDRTLAVAYNDKRQFDLIDANSGASLARHEEHRGPIAALCFSRDGRQLMSADGIGLVIVRGIAADGQSAADNLHKHEFGWANSISAAFVGDKDLAFIGGLQGTVRVWQPGAASAATLPPGHGPLPVLCLASSPDGTRVVSGCFDGSLAIWDATQRKLLKKLAAHRHQINRVAISPDGTLAATTSLDATVRLWNLASASELATLPCERPSWGVAFSPDGRTLATSHDLGESGSSFIQLWHVATRRELYRLPAPPVRRWSTLKFSNDGTRLYAAGGDGAAAGIYVWSTDAAPTPANVSSPSAAADADPRSEDQPPP
ncbi:MAG: WD40 repeat domain-containing serine/threonine protein kinase [Pirellulales bacterium]